jgi:predicted Ser/Thr protein kinase
VTHINVERLLRETPISVAPSSIDAVHQRLFGAAKRQAPEHYEIHEELGRGAFGRVYRATDRRFPRDVALKVIHYGSARQLANLEREARALAGLAHPNIIAVFDKGIADAGVYFLATERIDGTRLDEWMQDPARRLPELLEVFAQAAEGLHHAHQRGMIHRDFKPSNAIVGRDGRLRILDFGLVALSEGAGEPGAGETLPEGVIPLVTAASHVHHEPTRSSEWSHGDGAGGLQGARFRGTVAWASPEQLDGDPVDPRTDQFSLCVSLFEACHGFRPFSGRTVLELSEQMATRDIAQGASRHRVPRWLAKLLRRGLSPRPDDRFANVGEIAAVLREHLRPTPWGAMAAGMALALGLSGGLWAATRPDTIHLAWEGAWPEGVTAEQVEAEYGLGLRMGLEDYETRWEHARDAYAVLPERDAEGEEVQCLRDAKQQFHDFVQSLEDRAPQPVPRAAASEKLWLTHFFEPNGCLPGHAHEEADPALLATLSKAQVDRLAGRYDEALAQLESVKGEPTLQHGVAAGLYGYELGAVQLRLWDEQAWHTLMAAAQDTGEDRELLVEVLASQLEAGVILMVAKPAQIDDVLALLRLRARSLPSTQAVRPLEAMAEATALFGRGRHREATQAFARARELLGALEPSPHRDLMIAHCTLSEAYAESNLARPEIDAEAVEAAVAQVGALLGNASPAYLLHAKKVARMLAAYEGQRDRAERLLVDAEAKLLENIHRGGSHGFELVSVQAELLWLDLERHEYGEGMEPAARSKKALEWSTRAFSLGTRLDALDESIGTARRSDVDRVRVLLLSAHSVADDRLAVLRVAERRWSDAERLGNTTELCESAEVCVDRSDDEKKRESQAIMEIEARLRTRCGCGVDQPTR